MKFGGEDDLFEEINALTEELNRIKNGIKRNEVGMIIDGNDMCDWGWMTIADANKICTKRWGLGISQYPNENKNT